MSNTYFIAQQWPGPGNASILRLLNATNELVTKVEDLMERVEVALPIHPDHAIGSDEEEDDTECASTEEYDSDEVDEDDMEGNQASQDE